MTDLDTLIAAHPDAVTSVRTHDGHVVSHTVIVDNGDGTGTRTTYDEHGNETSVEQLTGLPIPDLPADPDLIPPDPTRLRSPR